MEEDAEKLLLEFFLFNPLKTVSPNRPFFQCQIEMVVNKQIYLMSL